MDTSLNKIFIAMLLIVLIIRMVFLFIDVFQDPSFFRKRAAILQRLAGGPQAESFSSATASIKGNHKRTVQLHETVYGYLTPSKFNGSWISDSDIMYRDDDGGISVYNLDTRKSYTVRIYKIKKDYCVSTIASFKHNPLKQSF